jgi:hypothetical protein
LATTTSLDLRSQKASRESKTNPTERKKIYFLPIQKKKIIKNGQNNT